MTILLIYVVIFVTAYFAVKALSARVVRKDFTSLKTVTFGDESAVRPNRIASIISVATIFLIWGAFTGSSWVPLHAPGPFYGDTTFEYTAERADGATDTAKSINANFDCHSAHLSQTLARELARSGAH